MGMDTIASAAPLGLPHSEKSTSTSAVAVVDDACSLRLLMATRYDTTSSRSTTAVTT